MSSVGYSSSPVYWSRWSPSILVWPQSGQASSAASGGLLPKKSCPVVSDADCCAVRPGFESRRHDVCKCIVPSGHGVILNSRRAASPLVRLVEGEERWEALTLPRMFSQNWGETELNRTVTCMVLKATANDRRTSSP
ncbi:uncharacterized protein TNCV_2675761 [Trichonephila clavipes]|nr:uncharacterized protein TNCV_2675761 [Trichonephila clavipes]